MANVPKLSSSSRQHRQDDGSGLNALTVAVVLAFGAFLVTAAVSSETTAVVVYLAVLVFVVAASAVALALGQRSRTADRARREDVLRAAMISSVFARMSATADTVVPNRADLAKAEEIADAVLASRSAAPRRRDVR